MHSGRKILLLLGDVVVIWASFFIMLFARFDLREEPQILDDHMGPFIALTFLWLIVFFVSNMYDTSRIKFSFASLRHVGIAITICALTAFLLFYLIPFPVAPKTNLVIVVLVLFVLLSLWRQLFYKIFAKGFRQKIAFLGETAESRALSNLVHEHPYIGYDLAETRDGEIPTADFYVLTRDTTDDATVTKIAAKNAIAMDVRGAYEKLFEKLPVSLVDTKLALELLGRRRPFISRVIWRIFEIVFSLLVLVVTLPFTILSAFAILFEDGGPIFYTQKRVGLRGQNFSFIKFRSMKKDAEKNGPEWAGERDPRTTKVGQVLRKLHIDEIPQMLNVIMGQMSLVGPRPERPEFTEKLEKDIPYYFLRHTAKPGFTGWAQIKFRYARTIDDSREKFEYDLFYLKNRNFFLDLGILAKTLQIIFTH